MKKIGSFILLCIALGSVSCKKNSSTPNTSVAITATIDGTPQTFNISAIAKIQTFNTFQVLIVSAAQGTGPNDYVVLLTAAPASGNIKTGSYSGAFSPGGGSGDGASVSYAQQNLGMVYFNDPTINATNATVVITSLTSTHVKGTFSGVLSLDNSNGATLKTVTNGVFDVDIQ